MPPPERADPLDPEMVGPGGGRRFRAERTVRLGDVTPEGRSRLDAVARWLQDVAVDDLRDAGAEDGTVWVVRRTAMRISGRPRYGQQVQLETWCSGVGAAWAERRTSAGAPGATAVEACTLWVSLDPRHLRPRPLDQGFLAVWGGAQQRQVRSRLLHPPFLAGPAQRRPLTLRLADFDRLGHVNNAIAWAVLEEEATRARPGAKVTVASVEYPAPVEMGTRVTVHTVAGDGRLGSWLTDPGGRVLVSMLARLDERGPDGAGARPTR